MLALAGDIGAKIDHKRGGEKGTVLIFIK